MAKVSKNAPVRRDPPEGWVPPPQRTRQPKFIPDRRFWELRAQGWSQRALAAEYGVSRTAVSRVLAPHEKRFYALPTVEQARLRARAGQL